MCSTPALSLVRTHDSYDRLLSSHLAHLACGSRPRPDCLIADDFASLLQALTQNGCQVRLTALGITSVQALSDRVTEAASNGVDAEDIARILLAARSTPHAELTCCSAGATPVRHSTRQYRRRSRRTGSARWTTWTTTCSPGPPHARWRPGSRPGRSSLTHLLLRHHARRCASLRQGGGTSVKGTCTPPSGIRRRNLALRSS